MTDKVQTYDAKINQIIPQKQTSLKLNLQNINSQDRASTTMVKKRSPNP